MPLCDVSFTHDRCRCRCFDFNQWAPVALNRCEGLGPSDQVGALNFPLERCEGIAGFYLKDHATEVAPKIKKLNNIKDQFCP